LLHIIKSKFNKLKTQIKMNKILSLILASIFTFGISIGQDIPNYIMPGDRFNDLNKETQEKIISLSKEMKKGGDPSFESVSSIFPDYMNYPKALVGIKEHRGRFLSSWDGAIISPPMYISFEVNNMPFESPEVEKQNHSLWGEYLPVIVRNFEYDGLIYEQTLFAYSKGFSTENPLIAFVRMKVKNPSGKKKNSTLSIWFRGTGVRPSTQIWATSGYRIIDCPRMLSCGGNKILDENGEIVFWSGSQGTFGNDKISYELSLDLYEEKELYFYIPHRSVREDTVNSLSEQSFDETLEKVRIFWKEVTEGGMQVEVPEKIVNNAYKTWRINNFFLVQEDKHRQSYKTIDAPFFYEGIFGYAAAMYLNTITTGGYFEEAKKCANMFLKLQRLDGGMSGVNRTNDIIPHQHGAMLYTICQVYRMGKDDEWFKIVAPDVIKACNWVIRERSKTKNMVDGMKPVTYGMLPNYRYNVDGGTGTQEYLGNSWAWAGLNQAAIALGELGGEFIKESIRLKKEADDYRTDIFVSMDKSVVKQNDLFFLPIEIGNKKPFKTIRESPMSLFYTFVSPRMLEAEIFDIDDERLRWLPDFLERGLNGIILGLCRFSDKFSYTAHFSAGYAISNLRMNRIDKFLLTFYGMLSYGMARELYSTQEHDNFMTGKIDPWYSARQPHLHSTSQLIRVTNQMLIKEEREEIWLAYGVPKKWLEDGKKIEVKKAQTCFGPFNYNIESFVSKGYIKTNISSSIRRSPTAIKLKLRHPQGKNISRVEVNGKVWKDFGKEIINLSGTGEEYSIVAYY